MSAGSSSQASLRDARMGTKHDLLLVVLPHILDPGLQAGKVGVTYLEVVV